VKLIIHRGSKEIGGSCVELVSGRTSVIVDLGMPLVNERNEPFDSKTLKGKPIVELVNGHVLPAVNGLYANEERGISAVLLSHAHQDHYGFLQYINPEIPVYMSRGAKILIEISDLFIPTKANLRNVVVFDKWRPFAVSNLVITPYLVDHSAFDAVAFLIEGEGKRIFYSGDFRGHGRKKILFEKLLSRPVRDIDCLLLEGSMLGRENGQYQDEGAVEERLVNLFKEKENIAFVFCSSQNIDRLVSIYRAVKRSGSLFVIDLYTAYILDRLSLVSEHLPQFDWDEIRVKYFRSHANVLVSSNQKELLYKYKKAKIEIEEIDENKKSIVMLMRDNSIFRACLKRLTGVEGAAAVYSMWDGYVTDKFMKTLAEHGIRYEHVHTSGHAVVEDLQRLAGALNARYVIPIHTFHPQDYPSFFKNVYLLRDGEEFFI
jgi:ribonuclease J